jgi:hypothetical protein
MGVSTKLNQVCNEAWPLAKMWYFARRAKVLPKDKNLAFCYEVLNKVSRRLAFYPIKFSLHPLPGVEYSRMFTHAASP